MASENRELNAKDKLVTQLQFELEKLDDELVNAKRLVSEELRMIQSGRHKHPDLIEIHHDKPMKLVQRIVIPVKEHPKFNFVGKLIGPKGNTMKMLQEQTGAKIAVYGRGSMRDREKEEEMRKQGGKYAHLNDDLHVSVEVFGPPAQGFQQIGMALAELQKYLIPMDDYEDDIRQQQMQELMFLNGGEGEQQMGRGRGRGGPSRGAGRGGRMGLLGDGVSSPSPRGRGRGLQSPRGMGQSTRGMGQSTRGMGQSTRGMGQSTRGMGQSTRGSTPSRGIGASPRGMARGMGRGSPAGRGTGQSLLGQSGGMGNGQSVGRGGTPRGRGAASTASSAAARIQAMSMESDDYGYSSYGSQSESYAAEDYSGGYEQDFTEDTQFGSYSQAQTDEASYSSFTDDWSSQSASSYSKPTRGASRGAGSRGASARGSVRSHPYAGHRDTYF